MDSSKRDGDGPPATVKAVAIILILILVLIVALLVRSENRHAAAETLRIGATGGGDEDPAPPRPHTFGDALHKVRMDQARRPDDAHVIGPPPPQVLRPPPKKVVLHGGRAEKKPPKPKKPWTQYKTWKALCKDKGAVAAYWNDVETSLNTLELDWSEVRKALAETVYDNREWAGRINYVDGKLKVVELVPSPYAVGEGPLSKQAMAMVPAEVMQKLEAKPGLFLFHTHPGETAGSTHPSGMDMAGAMHIGYTGRYAGEVVVSPYGVFLYTPSSKTRHRIWGVGLKDIESRITMLRYAADFLGAFDGARSWTSPWTLDDYASLARRYGMEYVAYPNDSYARQMHRMNFSTKTEVDHDTHQHYLALIKELEEEAKGQTIVATPLAPDEKGKERSRAKEVRFAPGV